jgi:hypothetical protein
LLNKLLKNEFINQMTNSTKIFRDNFIKNLDTSYKTFIEAFRFLEKDSQIKSQGETNKLILNVNSTSCECDTKLYRGESFSFNTLKYDKIESEFRVIEKENGGLFTISFLEDIFRQMDINPKFSNLICAYLRKKTQKNFIDFQNFKLMVVKLSTEDSVRYLFDAIAFPRDFIKKSDLFVQIKSFKNEINSSKTFYNIRNY